MRTLIVICLLAGLISVHADEGGPSWWWGCKKSDLIIRGKVTYDLKRYYQVIPPPEQKIGSDHYYICGFIKIDQVIYANPSSQYTDTYRHYLRTLGQEIEILVPAQREYFEHMKPDDIRLDPTVSGAFIPDSTIFSCDVISMFPVSGLVLQSSVPREKEQEAFNLISKRGHTLELNLPITPK